MKTVDYPVWLAVLPDQRDAARADAGKHPDGENAIKWSPKDKLWYARPGADLDRLKAWMPDPARRSGGGDPETEFLDALTDAGLIIDSLPIMDGEIHRVSVTDGPKGNGDGVYKGFLNGKVPGGWFINYWTAKTHKDITKWKASGGESDPVARLHMQAVARQSRDDSARALAATHVRQTAKAQALYDMLPPADPAHAYFIRKGVTADDDIRQTRNGALAIPLYDVDGQFRTLQYIPPDGEKYLYKEAPKAGHFNVVGGALRDGEPVLYAEGYATARSINQLTGLPVVMTVDAGNMLNVADVLFARYPNSPHIFMADDDHQKPVNTGKVMADQAAFTTAGTVLMPELSEAERQAGMTDFNDIHQARGAEALRATLIPRLNEALYELNYKETVMATPDDINPAPEKIPVPDPVAASQPAANPAVASLPVDEPNVSPAAKPDSAPETRAAGAELTAERADTKAVRNPGNALAKSEEILALSAQGMKAGQIAKELGIGQTSVYRILKSQKAEADAITPSVQEVSNSETAIPAMPGPEQPPAEPQTVSSQASDKAIADPEPAAVQPDVNVSQPAPQVAETETIAVPASTAAQASPAPSGPYDNYMGLYGTGAELRDRLAALTTAETSPAALLRDINSLRVRVDSAGIASVYSREHMKEMQQVFNRLTQGGMAGADVMDKGAVSRLRSLIGQRDTWNSLHPTSGSLDVNTIPEKVSQQYALLTRGDITRAQFDREVRMLYGEFTRAEPERFTGSRHADTQAVFERMAALQSPERAAKFTAATAVSMTQLPPASAEDLNSAALYRIQNELRDGFVSLARGESSSSMLTENVGRLQAKLDEAKVQGVYAESHLNEIQGAFDRVTQNGLAGMPAPDSAAPGGDFASRYPASASLDVASVPARVEAQYAMLIRGDVSRAQFEENLAILRNEVVRQTENGQVSTEALAAAEGVFANLSVFSAKATASDAIPQPAIAEERAVTEAQPDTAHAAPVAQPSMPSESAPVAAAPATADVTSEVTAPAAQAVTHNPAPAESAVQPTNSAEPEISAPTPAAMAIAQESEPVQASAVHNAIPSVQAAPHAVVPPEVRDTSEAEYRAEPASTPASAATPFAAAFGEENGILVEARRVAPQPEDTPAANTPRTDQDKLLSRVSHEDHPDGKSVIYRLDSEPAFIDRGNRLVMAEGASAHEEKVLAALLTAAKFYHGKIELTGSDEFKAFAINVIVTNGLQVSMKNPSQQLALDEAKRAVGQPVATPDAVRGDPVAPVAASTAAPAAPAAAAPAMAETSASGDMTQAPGSPEPEKPRRSDIRPDIHTPAEKAREPITGKVTACGQAPFRFDTGNQDSSFITLRTREGTQTFWGKELAGLMRETRLREGQMVTLQWMGEQPVTVNKPVKDTQGNFTGHYEPIHTKRNQWALTSARGNRVQTGGDEMIKLAAFSANRYTQVQHALVSQLGISIDAPPKPADGLFWIRPDGQGSASAGDALSALRPPHNEDAGKPVMTAWGDDGKPDLYLVQGDGHYLQGVVRQNDSYQHVLVSLPDSKEAPKMVINLLTPDGAQPIGSGNGINRSEGKPVPREHVVFRVTGDEKQRIAKLHEPASIPPALHARLGYDERYKAETLYPKEQPAAAPQAAPVTPPRPAQ
ncbi:LPD7 domain-containing protein [Erwinia amylovora]|uniref:LPD7 domain-containing protein n=1 Tax=Erwinia amylovora TaxID=552 RepID=UPI0001CCB917|nr:LPD7 domain-containing protein [Erwinia amylovora]CBJ48266.1 DNA primase [Erwinia amylovora ATCC 49946]